MCVYLWQNWGSDGRFEVLNRSYLLLVKKLWQKTQLFPFLFLLRFCTKTDICNFYVFCVFVFFVISFVPFGLVQHLKMTVWISVLWKISIKLAKHGQLWSKNGYTDISIQTLVKLLRLQVFLWFCENYKKKNFFINWNHWWDLRWGHC